MKDDGWRILAYNQWYVTLHNMKTGEIKHEKIYRNG